MNDNKLLNQIAQDVKTVKLQLGDVETRVKSVETKAASIEMKVELVNKKVDLVSKRVEQAQEETIETLSALIHEGYDSHEERIKKIEEQLQSPQTQ